MDEFDKIKEVSDDIMGRKEPTFTEAGDNSDSPFRLKPIEESTSSVDQLDAKWTSSYRIHLIALAVFSGVLVIALVGFFLAGRDDEPDEVITITATSEPVRVKPSNPGGAVIPDQGKQIYNRLSANAVPTKVEHLFPEPEKPVLPEELIQRATPEPEFVSVNQIKAVDPLADQPIVIVEEKPEPKTIQPVVVEKPQPTQKPVVKEVPVKEPTPKKVEQPAWRIQLLSTTKKASAEKAWPDILKKHKALLSDMSHDIVSAEIAGKGTFYRLQAGRFATRDMAKALCDKLAARKQACVPVKADK